MPKPQFALGIREVKNFVKITGKICKRYLFLFLVVSVILLIFLNLWLGYSDLYFKNLKEFLFLISNSIDILLVAILALITAYYASETGKLRKLQEEYIEMIRKNQFHPFSLRGYSSL